MGAPDGEMTDIKVVLPLSVLGRILGVSVKTLDYWPIPVMRPEGVFRCVELSRVLMFMEGKVMTTVGRTREAWRGRIKTLRGTRFRNGYFIPAVGEEER